MSISDNLAEAGVIATLIYNPTFIIHSDQLNYKHFYNKDSACLYWAIDTLIKQGVENIDSFNLLTTINSDENKKKIFESYNIDLDEYITLSKGVIRNTVEEYRLFVNRILALSFKRRLYKYLKKISSDCLDLNQDNITALSSDIYNTINKLNKEYILNDDIELLPEKIDNIWEEIIRDSQNEELVLYSKIPLLKNYFAFSKGEVFMFVARYKQGKSAYLMNEFIHQAKQGRIVAYFDTEMSTKEFVIRMLANLTGIEVRQIKQGTYSKNEKDKLYDALKTIKSWQTIHKYRPKWRNEDILSAAKIIQYKYGLDLLIFDYIKGNEGDANTLYNTLGKNADNLKNIVAGQLKIPILTATQLNRSGEISDSDKLARYVSAVIYLKQKNKEDIAGYWKDVGNYTMQVRTNRLGEQMYNDEYIHYVFDGNRMNIYQAPKQPANDDDIPI